MANQIRYPTGDDWSQGGWGLEPTSPTTYFDKLDEVSADDDTTMCWLISLSSGRGLKLFTFPAFNIPAGSTGITVKSHWRHKKTGGGGTKAGAAITCELLSDYYTPEVTCVKDVWTSSEYEWTQNPDTSLDWTVADVNGTSGNSLDLFGIHSTDANPDPFWTQCYLEVIYTAPSGQEELLAGTSDGLSTAVIPAMTSIREFAGSSAGVCTVSNLPLIENTLLAGGSDGGSTAGIPTIKCSLELSGVSNGVGVTADIPAMKAIRGLIGTSDGLSTADIPTIKCSLDIGGSSAGLSTVGVPAMTANRKLAGASDGACTVANIPEIKVSINIAGQSDGLSTADGVVKVSKTFIGLSSGVGAHSPPLDLKITKELIGDSDGLSTVAGVLNILSKLAGASDGLSTALATVEKSITLSGQSDGTSVVSDIPLLKLVKAITSSISCTSLCADLLLKVTTTLVGTSDGLSTAGASMAVEVNLAGTSDGLSTVEATTNITKKLVGQSDGLSTSIASLEETTNLAGASDGGSTAGANVKVTSKLSGASDGLSTAIASLTEATLLAGASDGLSNVDNVLLKVDKELVGASNGLSTAIADLDIITGGVVNLEGASDGLSTAGAYVEVDTTLIGISDGIATVGATVKVTKKLTAWDATKGTSTSIAAVKIAKKLNYVINESFEGTGYENDWWPIVGTGCTLDEDSTDVTPPSGGGSQTLKAISASTGYEAYATYTLDAELARTKVKFDARLATEDLGNTDYKIMFAAVDSVTNTTWFTAWYQTAGGDLQIALAIYYNDTWNFFYSQNISLDTWYSISMVYDDIDNRWIWQVDNNIIEGTLTGVHRTGVKHIVCGLAEVADQFTVTSYYDLVKVTVPIMGTSTASASLQVGAHIALAGQSNGTSTADASIKVTKELSGNSFALSTVNGAISPIRGLAGATDGNSTVSASIKRLRELAGLSAGTATVQATLKKLKLLSGTSNGTSTVQAYVIIGEEWLLAGTSSGTSTVTCSMVEIPYHQRGSVDLDTDVKGKGSIRYIKRLLY